MHNFSSPKKQDSSWAVEMPTFSAPPANTPWPFTPVQGQYYYKDYETLHVPVINDTKIAMKFDQHKARIELVDPLAIEGLAKVLEFGAKKYAVDNWRNGFNFTRIIGSLERHLNAIKRGEDVDPESGLPHIDHVGCNWMFLSFFMKERLDLDDRWYTKAKNALGSE